MTPSLPQPGHEGPTPVQHRCRTCRQPVETCYVARSRMLRAKKHPATVPARLNCLGSHGPVDPAADITPEGDKR